MDIAAADAEWAYAPHLHVLWASLLEPAALQAMQVAISVWADDTGNDAGHFELALVRRFPARNTMVFQITASLAARIACAALASRCTPAGGVRRAEVQAFPGTGVRQLRNDGALAVGSCLAR